MGYYHRACSEPSLVPQAFHSYSVEGPASPCKTIRWLSSSVLKVVRVCALVSQSPFRLTGLSTCEIPCLVATDSSLMLRTRNDLPPPPPSAGFRVEDARPTSSPPSLLYIPRQFPPPSMKDIPMEYIINRLHDLAPQYWNKMETTDCTLGGR